MTDAELLSAFEDCSLPEECWNHQAHVRVSFLYASTSATFQSALQKTRDAIQRYNAATNTPELIDRGYHETQTQAFLRLIYAATVQNAPCGSSVEFCSRHPKLLNKHVLRDYYSRERIMTWEAKRTLAEPDIAPLPVAEERFRVVESLTPEQVRDLHRLTQQQWWGGQRSLEDVETMVTHTNLMIGLVDPPGQLVGYCRALTDFAFRATIYDVMVQSKWQGEGLGKRLLDTLISHPRLHNVSVIYLACEPKLFPFYQRWGFRECEARAEWMIKVQREE